MMLMLLLLMLMNNCVRRQTVLSVFDNNCVKRQPVPGVSEITIKVCDLAIKIEILFIFLTLHLQVV
jgi:hypothetical protein